MVGFCAEETPYKIVTNQALQIMNSSRGLVQTFIIDGQIMANSLKALGKDMEWVHEVLKEYQISNLMNVSVAQMDKNGYIHLDSREDKGTEV